MKRSSRELWEKLRPLVREKRNAPTRAEDLLWDELRDRRLDRMKFRRQHVIERFIVDFYCAERRLAIELDGSSHDGRGEDYQLRREFLESLGLNLLRFSNDDVQANMRRVLARISSAADEVDR